jgi:hypothetical protein
MQAVAIPSAVPFYHRAHLACRPLGSQYTSSFRALFVHCFEYRLSVCMCVCVCHGASPNRRPRSPTNRHRATQTPANTGTSTTCLIMTEWSNGPKGSYVPPSFLSPSLHCAPTERTERFLNMWIFMWKGKMNIPGAFALVCLYDIGCGLKKLNYWKTNFPRDSENIAKPTL